MSEGLFGGMLSLLGMGGMQSPEETASRHRLTPADLERLAFNARREGNQPMLQKIGELRQEYGYDQAEPSLAEVMAERNREAQLRRQQNIGGSFNPYNTINDALLTRPK